MSDEKDEKTPGGGGDPSQAGHGGGQGDTPAPKDASPDEYKNIPGNQT